MGKAAFDVVYRVIGIGERKPSQKHNDTTAKPIYTFILNRLNRESLRPYVDTAVGRDEGSLTHVGSTHEKDAWIFVRHTTK